MAAGEAPVASIVQSSADEAAPVNPVLHQSIYRAVGEWAWINDLPLRNTRLLSVLDSREGYELGIKTGTAGNRSIDYLCKTCTSQRPWLGFLPEVVLFKQHLRPLQGIVVPALMQVTKDELGRISLVMAPPHPSFWIQASADMPEVLKEHCVAAVQKLHEAGVWHGDLLPSNVWLGGDGKVTIINFHKSRALTPCPRLGLFAATPADLDLEMRKFKWILDYRTTRIQEDRRFIRYMKRFRLNQERQRALPRRDIPPVEEMPQEDIAIPPLNPTACIMQWLPRDRTVARFIMPDQSPDRFMSALRHFFQYLEALKLSQRGAEDNQLSEEPADNPLSAISGSILSSLGKTWSSSGLVSLCRKRGRHECVDTEGPIRKKIRFTGVPENEADEDAFELPTDEFGPDISFNSADDPTGVTTRLKIVEANITQCTRLGLPHPGSIEQDPGNPRWLDPNVTEYLKRQERDRLQMEQACLYVQGTRTRVAPQRILRSAGRLRRTLRAISQPSSLLEPMNSGPSLKRGRHDDSGDLLANSQRPGKVRRCLSLLDSTSTKPKGSSFAKPLRPQRNPGRPTTLKNIHRRSGPGYQLRLRVKRLGREPPVPLSCIRVGKSGPTEMSSDPEPPYIGSSSSPSLSHQGGAGDLASGTPLSGHGGLYLPSSVISRWLGTLCRLVLES